MEKTMTLPSNVKVIVADDGTKWTEEEIRDYLKYHVSAKNITEEDVKEFFRHCKARKLNPYDVHLQKYGDGKPVVVISKYAFLKRAERSGKFAGYRAGIIVERSGKLIYREGSVVLKGEKLVGGWAEAYRTDWKVPAKVEVSLDEYMRKDKNGKPFPMWKEKPATMIRKVALVHVLREAFPNEVGGLEAVSDSNNDELIEEPEAEYLYSWDEEEGEEGKAEKETEDGKIEQKEEPKVTNEQLKLIWSLAQKVWPGKSKEEVRELLHQRMQEEFKKSSSKELTRKEADRLIKILKEDSTEGSQA